MGERPGNSGVAASADAEPGPQNDADRAFDMFLRRGLHKLYDNIADQPIPPELLRLIEEDRKAKAARK